MPRSEPAPLSIWIVNPFDDIPGEGLPPLRFWSLCRVLAGRGHDVTWWTASWSHRTKAARSAPLQIRDDEGFAVRLVAVRPYSRNVSLARLGSHRDFGRTFERLASESIAAGQLERPDVILASLPPLEGPEASMRIARRLDAALVVDLMDVWPETFARLLPGPPWLRERLAPILLGRMFARRRTLLAGVDAVSSCAHAFLDRLAGEIPAGVPRHVCHHGAWLPEFPGPPRCIDEVPREAANTAGAAAAPAAGGPLPLACVYAGSLEAGQDLDTLIAAMRLLSALGVAVTIHVAGSGRLQPQFEAAAASGGTCRLEFHGLLDRGGYVKLLSQCEVGLVCVKPESLVAMPYKACDYAAAGLAIVNSLPGELATLIEDHRAGLPYTAGDAQSLAKAIGTLAVDRRALLAMRQAARRLAEAEFDREKTFPRFAEWLEGICGAARSEP
jgi:glycosyltransferase involved in cell wall biosynthesis